MLWFLLACSPPPADRYMAWVHDGDGYAVAPRDLPGLTDAQRMSGALGTFHTGGRISFTAEGAVDYRPGRRLDVRYDVVDGVAWPLDDAGLLLFSFWGGLADTRAALDGTALSLEPLLPTGLAYSPSVSDIFLERMPVDNAAYATGGNLFILLPDVTATNVPVAANRGVVAHESAHGLFHLLTTGDPLAPDLITDYGSEAELYQSAWHEGFADSVAGIAFEDPRFIQDTFALEERWLDADGALNSNGLVLPEEHLQTDPTVLDLYDPYPLGTIFARLSWDLYLLTGDRELVLGWLAAAAEGWRVAASGPWRDASRFSIVDGLIAGTEDHWRADACALALNRFPGVELNACSGR